MIPSAFEQIAAWREERARHGHELIALAFDCTIAPIVQRPQEAYMLAGARAAIERLLKRPDTDIALISGRSLDDLRARAALDGVYYSGNHGLQIDGPGVHETRADAKQLIPRVEDVAKQLHERLAGIAGVYIEDKTLSLSVHSRMVEDDAVRERIHAIVESTVNGGPPGLRLTYGKRIVEVRPNVEWHKGKATLFLIDSIEQARRCALFPVFVGDDVTDEDAFAALGDRGVGVVVADHPPAHTAARAWVRSPEEVVSLLEAFAW
ncbi:MAG: trehalose-phosphatase [Gemmatimonadota bacterium]